MKITVTDDNGKEIKSMVIEQDGDIKPDSIEKDADKDGKMSKMFALKKASKNDDDDDDDEQDVKKGKPMKQKRSGLF